MADSSAFQSAFLRATTAHQAGRIAEARALYQQLLRDAPHFPDAVHFLGLLEFQTGNRQRGMELLERSIVLAPNVPHFHLNLGEMNRSIDRLTLAGGCFRRCIALDPKNAAAYNNLGNVLKARGQIAEAISAFRTAIALNPGLAVAHSNLLLTLHYDPAAHPKDIFAEHRRWAQMHGRGTAAIPRLPPILGERRRRLRVGYLSPDMGFHAVGFFLESILEHHDHARFEIFCYSDLAIPDETTSRMRRLADHWCDSSYLPDQQLAEMIRRDQIDVLFDLAGHTAGNRMPLFAARIAPLQITYLGYPDTTGLSTINYRITDSVLNPPGEDDHLYTEKLFRLDGPFACFRPPDDSPDVQPPPVMRKGYITFGCPGRLEKISPICVRWWSDVLKAVPGSRLLLMNMPGHDPETSDVVGKLLTSGGVDMGRVDFLQRQPFADYQKAHHEVDIMLETHPFPGHTTSCQALWMGVPVVTMRGRNFASRLGESLLTFLGLTDLIAVSPQLYVQIAAGLSRDVSRLTELRLSMRQRMQNSPVCDGAGFVRKLEAALRHMWESQVAEAEQHQGLLK